LTNSLKLKEFFKKNQEKFLDELFFIAEPN